MSNKIKLLVIDDEADFLNTIAERLEMRDFEVTKAIDGYKAIEAVKKQKYDIALLDLKMPGLDGMEVLDILKKEHKYIEVIILTAHGSLDTAFETSKKGAYSFLTKPYDFEELITVVKDAYENRLKRKFENDQFRLDKLLEIKDIPLGAESSLDMLEMLRELDDDVK